MSVYEKFSEEQLLLRLKTGDHAAFKEIYNRYWEEMANAAYQRLRSREDAEEVVQELFVSLYLRRNEISPKVPLVAYLKSALKYKVIDAYRAQQMHLKHLNNIIHDFSSAEILPDDKLCVKELHRDILAVVERLPEKCQEVFMKSRFEHLSHQCIANEMEISVSTVKKHLYKATGLIKKELNKNQSDLLLLFLLLLLQRN